MENASLKITKRGDVYLMTLLAGENRFNKTFLEHLHEAFDFLEKTTGAAALVTTSSDPKYFSLGLDFAALSQGPKEALAFLEDYQKMLARLVSLPMPTIAAINGHCTAGGGFFALCHDFTIASNEKGLFFMNEIDLGLSFAEGMAAVLINKLADHKLIRDVGVLGKRYSLADATKAGIFDSAVPAVSLLDRSISTAQQWASKAEKRGSMHAIKKELNRALIKALMAPIPPSIFPKNAKL